jgi:hypothetical protein
LYQVACLNAPFKVGMKILLLAMNTRVRSATSDDCYRRPKNFRENIFDHLLNPKGIWLALPTVVVASVIGDLKKIAHETNCPIYKLINYAIDHPKRAILVESTSLCHVGPND